MTIDPFSAHRSESAITLDPAHTAVLVVDMLNDFCKPGGAMVLPGYETLMDPQRSVIAAAREAGAPVIWVIDSHRTGLRRDREFLKRTPHCAEGSWGAQVIDDQLRLLGQCRGPQLACGMPDLQRSEAHESADDCGWQIDSLEQLDSCAQQQANQQQPAGK